MMIKMIKKFTIGLLAFVSTIASAQTLINQSSSIGGYGSASLIDTNSTSNSTSTVNTNNTSTATTTNTNTSTVTNTNTNTNINSGEVTYINKNVNSGEVTYTNKNISSGEVTYNNVNSGTVTNNNNIKSEVTSNNNNNTTSTNTNTNINSGTMTYNNTNNTTSNNTNNNTNNTTSTNTNTNTNTSTSENKNINTNTNTNNNVQTGDMTNRNINETTITQKVIQPPPTAIAPMMMSGGNQDLCTTGTSSAVQTQIFGVSTGGTVRDLNCERLKLSKTLFDMGMKVAAVATMCQDKRVWDAMMAAGTPCPYEGKIGEQAKTAWDANPEKVPSEEKEVKDDTYQKVGLGALIGILVNKWFN